MFSFDLEFGQLSNQEDTENRTTETTSFLNVFDQFDDHMTCGVSEDFNNRNRNYDK